MYSNFFWQIGRLLIDDAVELQDLALLVVCHDNGMAVLDLDVAEAADVVGLVDMGHVGLVVGVADVAPEVH